MLIEGQAIPAHVAIIMDGNGRWARDRGLPRPDGHREGMATVVKVVNAASDLGVRALTLYAFSEQNWSRPEEEVGSLMKLLVEYLIKERQMFYDRRIRLRAIGRLSRLPHVVRATLENVEKATSHHNGLTLSLCVSYGGREEVADAVKMVAEKVVHGELSADQIDEDAIAKCLPSLAPGAVDLLIRTGGEQRTSNFLIWAGVHADLYFSPKLWPEFGPPDLEEAMTVYQKRRLPSYGRSEAPGVSEGAA